MSIVNILIVKKKIRFILDVRNLTTYFNPFTAFVELIRANCDVQCVDYQKKCVRYDLSFYFRLRICTFDESIESKHDQCEARREEKENAKYYILCSPQLSVRRNAYKRTSVRYTVEESLVGMEKE